MPENSLAQIYSKSDIELVSQAKQGDSDSIVELGNRHEALFKNIVNKHKDYLQSSGVCPADLFDEKSYLVYEAIKTYNPEKKVKFNTWFGNRVRYHCLNKGNYVRKHGISVGYNDCRDLENTVESYRKDNLSDYINVNKEQILELLSELEDERIIQIFEMRYFGEKTMKWRDIANTFGLSTQATHNLHKKGLDILKRNLRTIEDSD